MELKTVKRDGKDLLKLKCPDCSVWGEVDSDQLNGLVSILCECGFHETIDIVGALNLASKAVN